MPYSQCSGRSGKDSIPIHYQSRLAIVDEAPKTQFMFPEFQLAQKLFEAKGIETLILDPSSFEYASGILTANGKPIDMVYNRLVDFALAALPNAALRRAYLEGAAVVTPNPVLMPSWPTSAIWPCYPPQILCVTGAEPGGCGLSGAGRAEDPAGSEDRRG